MVESGINIRRRAIRAFLGFSALALLTLLAASGLFGNTATVLACAVFAIPPLLTNTVTGLGEVDATALVRTGGEHGLSLPSGRYGNVPRASASVSWMATASSSRVSSKICR